MTQHIGTESSAPAYAMTEPEIPVHTSLPHPTHDDYVSLPAFVQEVIRMRQERTRQIAKFGEQRYDDGKWMWVLMEEAGEVAKELLEQPTGADRPERLAYLERLRAEVIQCATVCVAWSEHLSERIRALSV